MRRITLALAAAVLTCSSAMAQPPDPNCRSVMIEGLVSALPGDIAILTTMPLEQFDAAVARSPLRCWNRGFPISYCRGFGYVHGQAATVEARNNGMLEVSYVGRFTDGRYRVLVWVPAEVADCRPS